MSTDGELEIASDVAREAGDILLSYFDSDHLKIRAKGERDLVTAADTASERFVAERLRHHFPDDGLVAEEGSQRVSRGGRTWYVDPLDGTLNYARGVPMFSVSLSLFQDERPVLGVVHDPIRGELFSARAGLGARLNGVPVAVSGVTKLVDAFVHMTIDFHEESLWAGLRDIKAVAPRVLRTRNLGSAALALAYVAAGRFDAMIHRYASPWDYGAGMLLVQEAGGVATALSGEPYTAAHRSVLATCTRVVHDELTSVLTPTRVE